MTSHVDTNSILHLPLSPNNILILLDIVRLTSSSFKFQYPRDNPDYLDEFMDLLSVSQAFNIIHATQLLQDQLLSSDFDLDPQAYWGLLAQLAKKDNLQAFRLLLERLDASHFDTVYCPRYIEDIPVLWRQPFLAAMYGDPSIQLVHSPSFANKYERGNLPTSVWTPYWIQVFGPFLSGMYGSPTIDLAHSPALKRENLPSKEWIPFWIQIFAPYDKELIP